MAERLPRVVRDTGALVRLHFALNFAAEALIKTTVQEATARRLGRFVTAATRERGARQRPRPP